MAELSMHANDCAINRSLVHVETDVFDRR